MKILHELNQLDFGGVEKVVRNIIKFDKENEHTILAHRDGAYREELEKVGAKIIIAERDKEVILQADVIHVHSGGGQSKLISDVGAVVPVVETLHSPVRSLVDNSLISQRVGVTDVVSKMNHNCITVHNGIDFSDMETTKSKDDIKTELGIPAGIPIVGRLGRLGQDKELENWLLTCFYLQQEGVSFTPVIIGPEASNAKGYRGKLKLQAESLPVKGVVWADAKVDIANYLQIMDVFLYPSPTEGFGLVFVEAIYCGATVVTYKTDVTMELIGGYARLTEKSIYGLRDGVKDALDKEFASSFQDDGRQFVIDNYSAQRMSADYQDIYRKVKENEQSN